MNRDNQAIRLQLEAVANSFKKLDEVHQELKLLGKASRIGKLHNVQDEELEQLRQELRRNLKQFRQDFSQGKKLIDSLAILKNGVPSQELTTSCRRILFERYVLGNDWPTIADKIGYSVRQTSRLHGLALDSLRRGRE